MKRLVRSCFSSSRTLKSNHQNNHSLQHPPMGVMWMDSGCSGSAHHRFACFSSSIDRNYHQSLQRNAPRKTNNTTTSSTVANNNKTNSTMNQKNNSKSNNSLDDSATTSSDQASNVDSTTPSTLLTPPTTPQEVDSTTTNSQINSSTNLASSPALPTTTNGTTTAQQSSLPNTTTPSPLLAPNIDPTLLASVNPQVVNPEYHFYTQKIRNLAYEIDLLLKRRGYSLFRVLIGSLIVIAVVIYKFGENIKNFFSHHGADVASKSLESKNLKMSAEQLSKDVVQQVLSDPKTVEQAVNFLSQLFARKDTQDLLVALLLQVLKDPTTQAYVSKFVKETVAMYLLNDEQTMQVTSDFVYRILQKPETKEQLVMLLNNALKDESFRQSVAEMFSSVILFDVVKKSGAELGADAVHTVLEDQAVKQHAETFITAVLLNQKIQHDAGFALWEALKVSLTPTWFYHPPKTTDQAQPGAEQDATSTTTGQAQPENSTEQNKPPQKEPSAVTESANSVANPALEQEQISQAAQSPAAALEQNLSSQPPPQDTQLSNAHLSQSNGSLTNLVSSAPSQQKNTSLSVSPTLSIQESSPPLIKESFEIASTPPQTSSKPTTSTQVALVNDNNNKQQ